MFLKEKLSLTKLLKFLQNKVNFKVKYFYFVMFENITLLIVKHDILNIIDSYIYIYKLSIFYDNVNIR